MTGPQAIVKSPIALLLSCAICLSLLPRAFARGIDEQQSARRLTRQLVGEVLDLQLQYLDQNNLRDSPIRGQILQMRDGLDRLIEEEMQQVVALLTEAETADPTRQAELRREAAGAARKIIERLVEQKQSLQIRLATLDMANDIRRVIDAQQQVTTRTEEAARLSGVDKELATIQLADAERSVGTLAAALQASLNQSHQQTPELADTAEELLQEWRKGAVEQKIKAAAGDLELGNAEASLTRQREVMERLKAVLARAESKLSGEPPTDVSPAKSSGEFRQDAVDAEKLADYLKRLADLQAQVERENPNDPAAQAEAHQFIADKLEKVRAARPWDEPLAGALEEAVASQAAAGEAQPEKAAEESQQAGQYLTAAQQAAEREANESQRKAAAARFGELSRAADALEKATAVEQGIAALPDDKPWDADSLQHSVQQQATIQNLAEHVAKSLEQDAPEIAANLRGAKESVEQLEKGLQEAAQTAAQNSDAAADQKTSVPAQAAAAAEALSEISKQLRQQMHQEAGESEGLSGQESQAMQQAAAEQHRAQAQLQSAKAEADRAAEGGDPAAPPSEQAQQAQQELAQATERHAAAQQAAGQLAEQIAGQSQVGDQSILQALDDASRFGTPTNAPGQSDHGYVPADPGQTARMMAGQHSEGPPEASEPGEGKQPGQGGEPGEQGDPGESTPKPDGPPGQGNGESQPGESSAGGGSASNGPPSDGEVRRRAIERNAPWLLKLPPEVRDSIRAAGEQPPPPGYEDRLRRYFESLE